MYKDHFGAFFGIGAFMAVILFVVEAVIVGFGAMWAVSLGDAMSTGDTPVTVGSGLVLILLFGVMIAISMIAQWWTSCAVCAVTDAALYGHKLSVGHALRATFPRLSSLWVWSLVAAVIVGVVLWFALGGMVSLLVMSVGATTSNTIIVRQLVVGMLVFALVCLVITVVAYVLQVMWFVTLPVMVVERVSVTRAWSRSARVTRGSRGIIFLLILVVGLALGFATSVIQTPVSLLLTPVMVSSTGPGLDLTQIIVPLMVELLIICAVIAVTTPVLPIISHLVYRDRTAWQARAGA